VKLSDLGEFGFIQRIASRYPTSNPAVLKGIGDDAAAVTFPPGQTALLSTDQLIEGVHFRLETTDPWSLGWKSLAVNISDIAAMGGSPVGFTISLGVPVRTSIAFLDSYYDGIMSLAEQTGTQLLGGDTAGSGEGMFISVSIIGSVMSDGVVYRSTGKDEDDVYVTGCLGEAALGLIILERNASSEGNEIDQLRNRHLRPFPRLEEGRALAEKKIARSMIDVSDGLIADLRHICTESVLGAIVETEHIPISTVVKEHAEQFGADPLSLALSGGEDYELVFSADRKKRSEIASLGRQWNCPISRIGRLSRTVQDVVVRDAQGHSIPVGAAGYDHFKK